MIETLVTHIHELYIIKTFFSSPEYKESTDQKVLDF